MIERYFRIFNEMAFDKQQYESKIEMRMVNFMEHVVKLKLCDRDFGDAIYKGLSTYTKNWEKYWIGDCKDWIEKLFKFLNEQEIKSSSKEKVYRSACENLTGYIDPNTLLEIIKKATSETDEFKKDLNYKVGSYRQKNKFEDTQWFKEILSFLQKLTPIKNKPISVDEAMKEFNIFIKKFMKDFAQ